MFPLVIDVCTVDGKRYRAWRAHEDLDLSGKMQPVHAGSEDDDNSVPGPPRSGAEKALIRRNVQTKLLNQMSEFFVVHVFIAANLTLRQDLQYKSQDFQVEGLA